MNRMIFGRAGFILILISFSLWTNFFPTSIHAQAASGERAYVAGRFALELDGVPAGTLSSIKGGSLIDDVTKGVAPDQIAKKHIGGVKYEDITISCGLSMGGALNEWINASMAGGKSKKNLTIVGFDGQNRESSRIECAGALITEVGFPACDGSSKDPAYMTIKFTPEATRYTPGDGSVRKAGVSVVQKKWLPANFRLRLGDLPCERVNKIDAFTWKQAVRSSPEGVQPLPSIVISFILLAADREPFEQWMQRKGTHVDGSLAYLAPDKREELARLEFQDVDLLRIAPSAGRQTEEVTIKFIRCELK